IKKQSLGVFDMAKKHTEMTDKQTAIKTYMRNQLLLQNIIDQDGNILDLARFNAAVTKEINQVNKEMDENTTPDSVVIDRIHHACLIGELEYLQNLLKHKKNIEPLQENPIVSYEDLPPKRNIIKEKYQNAKLLIQNKLTNLLFR
ncbi:MAG: hypothetical protein IJS34_02665, partial [Alphaproteobacteria bacterium]|nr:hypothetical protein [Alphaproteobacteria bacterium]